MYRRLFSGLSDWWRRSKPQGESFFSFPCRSLDRFPLAHGRLPERRRIVDAGSRMVPRAKEPPIESVRKVVWQIVHNHHQAALNPLSFRPFLE